MRRRSQSSDPIALRFRAGSLALLSALVCLTAPSIAGNLGGAVRVDGEPVPAGQVQEALDGCAAHEPEMVPKDCLEEYWVPRWLLDREAEERDLRRAPAFSYVWADMLHVRLAERIHEEQSPTPAEIERYLEDHARDFEKPLRIRIFRILVATKEEAQDLIAHLKPTTTVKDFRALARDHSLDRATNERAGDLGFVWPNGSTDVPQVSADKALYSAALALEEGEFASEPVAEGKRYAVIWRRGSLPAVIRSEESTGIARARIREKNAEAELQVLLKALSQKVRNRDTMLLGKLRRKEASLFKEP